MEVYELPDATLYVSGHAPTEADRLAEAEVTKLIPGIAVERVPSYSEMSTPRLHVGRSRYLSQRSIRGFFEQERFQRTL